MTRVGPKAGVSVLGINVDPIDYTSAVAAIISAAKDGRSFGVTALAVHGIMTGVLDREHRYRLNQFSLVVPDGQPVRWALNARHRARLRDRVYGPKLMLAVCEAAANEGIPVGLFGSSPEVLKPLATNLGRRLPALKIVCTIPSRFRRVSEEERDEQLREIKDTGTRILFVALGCPRQEVWVYENLTRLSMPMLAVGAAFDFHAGTLSQAPAFLQRAGLEWAYRLAKEPRRLWRRYVLLNPAYLSLLLLQLLRFPRWDRVDVGEPPTRDLRFG